MLLQHAGDKPVVLDADALNLMAVDGALQKLIRNRKGFTVLTPHMGEFSRLCGKSMETLKTARLEEAAAYAVDMGVTLLSKDAVSVVTSPEGQTVLIDSGNNGMATAGSGDVLAGITAALLGIYAKNDKSLFDAVTSAAYLHGLAGTDCLQSMPEDFVMAGDIIERISEVLGRIRKAQKEE